MVRLSSLNLDQILKDEKLWVQLSHSTFTDLVQHHCLKREGSVDPGSVANLSWAGWVICIRRDLNKIIEG